MGQNVPFSYSQKSVGFRSFTCLRLNLNLTLVPSSRSRRRSFQYDKQTRMGDKEKPLYHYTNKKGAEAISQSKVIKASTKEKGDAVYGPGTYLTSLSPEKHSKKEIRQNNYDDGSSVYNNPIYKDKADYVVVVSGLPENKVTKVPSKQEIYVHQGNIDLNDGNIKHKIIKKKK